VRLATPAPHPTPSPSLCAVSAASSPPPSVFCPSPLPQVLRAARNPGSPPHALSLTLRGLGYVFATLGLLPQAEAAYARALSEARARGGDTSAIALSCWRDVAVMALEQRKYLEAEKHWRAAVGCLVAMGRKSRKGGKRGHGEAWGGGVGGSGGVGDGGGGGAGAGDRDSEMKLQCQLCIADCLRLQMRHAEAEPLIRAALASREREYGAEDPRTLGVVYDLSHLVRARVLQGKGVTPVAIQAGGEGQAAIPEGGEGQGEGGSAGVGKGAAGQSAGGGEGAGGRQGAGGRVVGKQKVTGPSGSAVSGSSGVPEGKEERAAPVNAKQKETGPSDLIVPGPSGALEGREQRAARVRAAMAAAEAETAEMDARWLGGLKAMCKEEPDIRWAEQARPRPRPCAHLHT
jgi:hypothetical protein